MSLISAKEATEISNKALGTNLDAAISEKIHQINERIRKAATLGEKRLEVAFYGDKNIFDRVKSFLVNAGYTIWDAQYLAGAQKASFTVTWK